MSFLDNTKNHGLYSPTSDKQGLSLVVAHLHYSQLKLELDRSSLIRLNANSTEKPPP